MSGSSPTAAATLPDCTEASLALRRTSEIRRRAAQLTDRARNGESRWFTIDDARAPELIDLVSAVTRQRYPSLTIPYHSRWRHFEAGGIDRRSDLDARLGDVDQAERARAYIDLTVVSVLLDAGAGPSWYFDEPGTGRRFTRSEGLAVASFHAFVDGLFAGGANTPPRVDAAGLRALRAADLAAAFGVADATPLVGLEGRVALLHRLADALDAHPAVYAGARPGGLYDYLTSQPSAASAPPTILAHTILTALLETLSPVWLTDNSIGDTALGDCWPHDAVRGPGASAGWMPFHKLSQWLTYSLLEPMSWSGHPVTGLGELTALPEYRNGGLLLDTGMIRLRDPALADRRWQVGSELVVEWRAMTISLLDELAPAVAAHVGMSVADLPLACVLEGGTWAAGRLLAAQRRDGLPPLHVVSDGTVF